MDTNRDRLGGWLDETKTIHLDWGNPIPAVGSAWTFGSISEASNEAGE